MFLRKDHILPDFGLRPIVHKKLVCSLFIFIDEKEKKIKMRFYAKFTAVVDIAVFLSSVEDKR